MDSDLRSLSYVILFASISAVSVLGVIGFLNNAYADDANMSDNMSTSANMTLDQNKTLSENMNMSENMNTNGNMSENMNTNGNMSMTNIQKVLSPLEQFKSGTPAKNVQCNEGFTLVIKIDDGSPACVSSQIAQALIARGWGTTP
jgi:hypothetical protein